MFQYINQKLNFEHILILIFTKLEIVSPYMVFEGRATLWQQDAPASAHTFPVTDLGSDMFMFTLICFTGK